MITRALDGGIPASWVAGDEVYGGDSKLRAGLHERAIGYVLAVACDHQVTTLAGRTRAEQGADVVDDMERTGASVQERGEPHRRAVRQA
jgi:SRSO17 transposase